MRSPWVSEPTASSSKERGGASTQADSQNGPVAADGEPVTPKSDVFSLGAVLYEMLTGQPAFTGDNVLQLLEQIRNVAPDHYVTEVPEPFADILRRSFVREVRDRSITMDRIAEMLK
jgi:serine/threonine protein kinase